MKIHVRYKDTEPFYEVDCVPEIGCDIIQIIATDPYRFTADGWRVNVTQDEDCGLLAVAAASAYEMCVGDRVQVRVNPKNNDFVSFVFESPDKFSLLSDVTNVFIVLYGSVGEELARWEVK